MVEAFRTYGHLQAEVDPLKMMSHHRSAALELDPATYGFVDSSSSSSSTQVIDVTGILAQGGKMALKDILQHLRSTYAGPIGFEFNYIPDSSERRWFANYVETLEHQAEPAENKRAILHMLTRSEVFDKFMAKRFPQVKRYGLEGAEAMMPAVDALFQAANADGVHDIVLGMPHRGRLNLLTDVLKYDPTALFHKVKGNSELPEGAHGTGDVISHLSIKQQTNLIWY